jgi:hypothetical protein
MYKLYMLRIKYLISIPQIQIVEYQLYEQHSTYAHVEFPQQHSTDVRYLVKFFQQHSQMHMTINYLNIIPRMRILRINQQCSTDVYNT